MIVCKIWRVKYCYPKQVKDMFETSSSNWFFRCCITLLLTATWSVAQVVAQQRVDPAVRARLDREFTEAHPPKGPQPTRETPLHIAARSLSPEYVRFLLSKKAKNAELDQSELTPLAAAILETLSTLDADSARGLETIKELIEEGCPKDAKDTKGQTIVDAIETIVRQSDLNESKTQTLPNYELGFRTQKYDGLVGFDSTKLTSSPLLKKILECLK